MLGEVASFERRRLRTKLFVCYRPSITPIIYSTHTQRLRAESRVDNKGAWLMNLRMIPLCRGVKLMCFSLFLLLQYGQRVPTAASPSNTNSSSSSNTGSQSGTLSTSLSNTNTNNTMGPSTTTQQAEQLSKINLYIRGLQQGTTDKDLHNMCSQWVSPQCLFNLPKATAQQQADANLPKHARIIKRFRRQRAILPQNLRRRNTRDDEWKCRRHCDVA